MVVQPTWLDSIAYFLLALHVELNRPLRTRVSRLVSVAIGAIAGYLPKRHRRLDAATGGRVVQIYERGS